ncbi:hypothetical protein JCM24511_07756 [Saitozyma sp. JCM 24511]|nr:hypothetical protein JCM24511_07756 [Saitozyma sp. JCM 24511]
MSRPAPLSLPSSSTPRRATSSSRPVPDEDTPPPPTASSLHSRVSSRTVRERDWEREGTTASSTDKDRDGGRGSTAEGSSSAREVRQDWASGSGSASGRGMGRGLPAVKGTIGALESPRRAVFPPSPSIATLRSATPDYDIPPTPSPSHPLIPRPSSTHLQDGQHAAPVPVFRTDPGLRSCFDVVPLEAREELRRLFGVA